MGTILSCMHKAQGTGTGNIDPELGIGTGNSWREFLIGRASNGKRKNIVESYLGINIEKFLQGLDELEHVPRILHLDYNPANVLIGNDQQLYVIDPVGVCGDRLLDVANSIINLSQHDREQFLKGYESNEQIEADDIIKLNIYETVSILNKLGNVLSYKRELRRQSLDDNIVNWLDGKVESWIERERRYLKRLEELHPDLMNERRLRRPISSTV
ncbi:MAG: hypothetical protein QT09_C0012G0010 [archaeon GW2011_AR18]|nr:MAG: hypothetical protein QT09_C0012G0010 [archaeon GW2011_AR18]